MPRSASTNQRLETFRLALETAGERELARMRQGDKLLEATIALAPLLGLLGTVTGLMITFFSLNTDNPGEQSIFLGSVVEFRKT